MAVFLAVIGFLALLALVCVVPIVWALRRSPVGYEDQVGFHGQSLPPSQPSPNDRGEAKG